jgi:methylglyoxal synthase
MPGGAGGMEQITSRISYNEIDLVFYFRSTDPSKEPAEAELNLLRLCDVYNIPLATNIASAEVLVQALDAGSFNWRDFVNPRSEYNLKKRK